MSNRIDPAIVAMLEESGLQWEIKRKKRHDVIVLCGRQVQTISRGKDGGEAQRVSQNARSTVKRKIRELQRLWGPNEDASGTSGRGQSPPPRDHRTVGER